VYANVRKNNENEVIKLSSTIDEVYANVRKLIDVTNREAIAQIREYADDKFRAVLGDMQHEISKVNATFGELQNKLSSGNSNTPPSADSGNAIVRVIYHYRSAGSISQ
jgi:hypothetical protein